ncbi:Peptidyl-prolyl cis-trans isomerase [Minicystis rosea]|nr:Peptidyl-prolyl cis-trans isomerase [Minicystis rosea]
MLHGRLHDGLPAVIALPVTLLLAGCAGAGAPPSPSVGVIEVAAPPKATGPDPKDVEASAMRLLVAKRFDEARAIADDCLAARPEACECLELFADVAVRQHNTKAAYARARAAVERCPTRGRAAALLVTALLEERAPAEAEAEARRKLALLGDDPDLILVLAVTLQRQGRDDEALAEARRAVAMKTGRDALILVAALAINARQLDEAERALERIVEQYADDADAHYNLGLVADRRGDVEGALRGYEAALRVDPKHHEALKNSAIVCLKAARVDDARAYAKRLAEAHPASADIEQIQRLISPPAPRPLRPHTGTVEPSPDDPLHGKWTLAEATSGLPPGKSLVAVLETTKGSLECKLFDRQAPLTVANFVGLARGNRPWKTPDGRWQKKRAYDGAIFHRVVKGFMIQGGDPKKDGTGEAGYFIPDEIWDGGRHDRAGLLCAANRGPDTNSMQFFITDAAAPHLDGGYTIFGECAPVDVVHQIASVAVQRERPLQPPEITRVTVLRR